MKKRLLILISAAFAIFTSKYSSAQTHELDVPYINQSYCNYKKGCGYYSLQMVLSYYENTIPTDALVKQMAMDIKGKDQCDDSSPWWWNLRDYAIQKGYEAYGEELTETNCKEKIEQEIKNGNPVIALVHTDKKEPYEPWADVWRHYVVIRGFDDNYVYVNDPYDCYRNGENKKVSWEKYKKSASRLDVPYRVLFVRKKTSIINSGIKIYAGKPQEPKKITVNFEAENLTDNFIIGDIFIGDTFINDSDVSNKQGSGSFDLDLSNYAGIFENKSYDFSFRINVEQKYSGKNQIYFLDPFSIKKIEPADWFYQYVIDGVTEGLFKGYDDGEFKPERILTKGEAAKVIVEAALKLNEAGKISFQLDLSTANGTFNDVPPTHVFFPYVQTLLNKGYVADFDNFLVNGEVTAAEFAKMLCNTLQLTVEETNAHNVNEGHGILGSIVKFEITDPAKQDLQQYLEILHNIVVVKQDDNGIKFLQSIGGSLFILQRQFLLKGEPITISGEEKITRAMMAKILLNAYEYRLQNAKNQKRGGEVVLENYTIIGDLFELTGSTYGTAPSGILETTKTLESGEVWEMFYDISKDNGEPKFYYWVVNGGKLESLAPAHNHVKFTAPEVTETTEFDLIVVIGTATGKITRGDVKIVVKPIGEVTPSVEPYNLQLVSNTPTSMTLQWNRGNGEKCLVACTEYNKNSTSPQARVYTYNPDLNIAPLVATGAETQVVYVGTSNQTTITGMDYNTTYLIEVYEYNISETGEVTYSKPLTRSLTTDNEIIEAPSSIFILSQETYSFRVGWSRYHEYNHFKIQRSTSPDFSTDLNEQDIIRTASQPYLAYVRLPFGKYYFRVKIYNPDSNIESEWSDVLQFDWNSDIEPYFIQDGLSSTITANQAILNYKVEQGNAPIKYTVYVADFNPLSTTPVAENITNETFTVSNLLYNQKYLWIVKAIDSDGDEAISPLMNFTIAPETTPPNGSITIAESPATNTLNISLILNATDTHGTVDYMQFSNDNTNWSQWYRYASTFNGWDLSDYGGNTNPGTKTVYARFKDNSGNVSAGYAANVTYSSGNPGFITVRGKKFSSLRRAINYAEVGDNIYVSAGYYNLTEENGSSQYSSLSTTQVIGAALKDGINLIGEGADRTTLYWDDLAYYGLVLQGNNTVSGLTFIRPPDGTNARYAIGIGGAQNCTISNCVIKNSRHAIYVGEYGGVIPQNITVNNCVIYNNTGNTYFRNVTDIKFYNNVIFNCGWAALSISSSSTNIKVKNNIIANNGDYAVTVPATTDFKNNNVWNNSINYEDGTSWLNDQTGLNGNLSTDPKFISRNTGNFTLQNSSPCIDKGINVGYPYFSSHPDIGAYEYSTSNYLQLNTNLSNAQFVITKPNGNNFTITGGQKLQLALGTYGIYPQKINGYYMPEIRYYNQLPNTTTTVSMNYIADNIPPSGELFINGGDYATQSRYITVYNNITDEVSGLGENAQMRYSNNGTTWSVPIRFSNKLLSWDIEKYGGDLNEGEKTLYAQFSDNNGNWSSTITTNYYYVPNGKITIVDNSKNISDFINQAIIGEIIVVPAVYHQMSVDATVKKGVKIIGLDKNLSIISPKSKHIKFEGGSSITNIQLSAGGYEITSTGTVDYIHLSNCIIEQIRNISLSSQPFIISNSIFRELYREDGFIYSVDAHSGKHKIFNNVFDATGDDLTNNYGEKGLFLQLANFDKINSINIQNNIFTGFNIGDNSLDWVEAYGGIVLINDDVYTADIHIEKNVFYNSNPDVFLQRGPGVSPPIQSYYSNPELNTDTYKLPEQSLYHNIGVDKPLYNNHNQTTNTLGIEGGLFYNTPPVAKAVVTPEIGVLGTEFTFDATASIDEQTATENLQYRWDFDGDGVFDTDFHIVPTVNYTYNSVPSNKPVCWVFDEHFTLSKVELEIPVTNQSPEMPTNLTALSENPYQISLNWQDNSLVESNFKIYKAVNKPVLFSPIATVDANTISFIDNNCQPATKYYYYVEAINSIGTSPPFNQVEVQTQSLPPSNVTASLVNTSEINLTWTNTITDKNVIIERSLQPDNGFNQIASISAGSTTYTDTEITETETQYYYRIRYEGQTADISSNATEIENISSITLSQPSSQYCAGNPISLNYTLKGNFDVENQLILQLSNKNGDFTNTVDLKVMTSNQSGTISASAPLNAEYGTKYKLRLVSTNPKIVSNETNIFTIKPTVFPSVSIKADKNEICAGESVTFTSELTDYFDLISGAPLNITYQWSVNSIIHTEYNLPTLTLNNIQQNTVVSLTVVVYGYSCIYNGYFFNSNYEFVLLKEPVSPDVEIYAFDYAFCEGSPIDFSAFPVNGGTNPVFTWKINDEIAGTGETLFADIPNNATVSVEMTSTAECVSQNTVQNQITISHLALPDEALKPLGDSQISAETFVSEYAVTEIANATDYFWTISPLEAATIDNIGNTASIHWSTSFSGEANITVKGENICGSGIESQSLTVTVEKSAEMLPDLVPSFSTYVDYISNDYVVDGYTNLESRNTTVFYAGQKVDVAEGVTNLKYNDGITVDNEMTVKCFLSTDNTYSADDILLTQNNRLIGDIPGYIHHGSPIVISDFVDKGIWYVITIADFDNTVEESDETNNTIVTQIEIVDTPDLQPYIELAEGKSCFNANELPTFNFGAKNIHHNSSAVLGLYKTECFLSTDNILDENDSHISSIAFDEGFLLYDGVENQISKNLAAGTYFIIATADTYNDIPESNETNNQTYVQISVTDNNTISIGSDATICEGENKTLDAGEYQSYSWSNNTTERTVEVSENGIYSVKVTDVNGCVFTSEPITITVQQLPQKAQIPLGETQICENTSQLYSSPTIVGATEYQWDILPSSAAGIEVSGKNALLNLNDSFTGKIYLAVKGVNKCGEGELSEALEINVNPLPVANYNFSINNAVASFTNTSTKADSYEWTFGDGNQNTEENPVHSYQSTGSYNVKLTAKNSCGENMVTQTIYIVIDGIAEDYLSDAFKIYPNPTQGKLLIENKLDKSYSFEILSTEGKVLNPVGFENPQGFTELDLSQYAQGVYLVRIKTDKEVFMKRVVLVK